MGGLTPHPNPPEEDAPAWGEVYWGPGVLWTSVKQLEEKKKPNHQLMAKMTHYYQNKHIIITNLVYRVVQTVSRLHTETQPYIHVSAVVLFADVFLQDTGVNVCWLQRAVNIMTYEGNRGRERQKKVEEESERGG